MECPDCGYRLPPFDKDCPRCKRLGAEVRQKRCPDCGKLAPLSAVACEGCGHAYRTRFVQSPPSDMPPTQISSAESTAVEAVPFGAGPLAPPHPLQPSPLSAPVPLISYQPPLSVFVTAPAAPRSQGGGWQTTLMVLLFATPIGWVVLIGLLLLLLLLLRFAVAGLPIIAATLAALVVARLDGSRLDTAKKPALIVSLLALGFVANAALWWIVTGRPERNVTPVAATVGASPSAGTPSPPPGRLRHRLFLRRLFQRQ